MEGCSSADAPEKTWCIGETISKLHSAKQDWNFETAAGRRCKSVTWTWSWYVDCNLYLKLFKSDRKFQGASVVASHPLTYKCKDFVAVNTPGFDDRTGSDRDILRILVTWLDNSFVAGEKLAGIIYFYQITDVRMSGSALKNLSTFRELCRDDCCRNIILSTSFWRVIDGTIGEMREHELKGSGGYWALMIRRGSRAVRIPDDQTSARELLFQLASKPPCILQAQRETIFQGRSFDETSASQKLQDEELKRWKNFTKRR